MIRKFRHKGLARLYHEGISKGLLSDHVEKIRRILARLDQAETPQEMDLPGYRLHPLKGRLAGYWSVMVQANWRIIFRFQNGEATDVDFVDYH